jgi:hypothetical protein
LKIVTRIVLASFRLEPPYFFSTLLSPVAFLPLEVRAKHARFVSILLPISVRFAQRGESEQGIDRFARAIRLNPLDPLSSYRN